jgi:hypothetical protein
MVTVPASTGDAGVDDLGVDDLGAVLMHAASPARYPGRAVLSGVRRPVMLSHDKGSFMDWWTNAEIGTAQPGWQPACPRPGVLPGLRERGALAGTPAAAGRR